ncbi:MAG: hypothetical protein B1H12_03500 [Desulfobacteraceae bacterium 4484_190.2]|nr:MAG: hypothetical protein B1H12_03500 [Desulfobacteraceae bacterium 4484_190.2]
MNEIRWSKTEKKKAKEAFEKAYERECAELARKIRAKVKELSGPDDIWRLHDFLTERRRELDEKYDYRYSALIFVFARLIKEGWLSLEELDGVGEDKTSKIAALLDFAAETMEESDDKLPKDRFTDPILGRLTPLEYDEGWQVEIEKEGETIRFEIAGDSHPSEALLAHTRDLLKGYSKFKATVHEFLDREKRKFPSRLAQEIDSLGIEAVCLGWSDRPDHGTIYFAGRESPRVWHCDCIGGKPQDLGFDR